MSSGSVAFGFVVPLEEELEALRNEVGDTWRIEKDEKGTYFYRFEVQTPNGAESAVAVQLGHMGEKNTALNVDRLVDLYEPRNLVVLGIAGGISADVAMGDVVVADQIDSYLENAKATDTANGFALQRSTDAAKTSWPVVKAAQNFRTAHPVEWGDWVLRSESLRRELEDAPNGKGLREHVGARPSVHVGHIVSGSIVSASAKFAEFLKSNDRKALAVEMEAGGASTAANSRAVPVPLTVVRGISDPADGQKAALEKQFEKLIRKYAVRNAAAFVLALAKVGAFPASQSIASNTGSSAAEPTEPKTGVSTRRTRVVLSLALLALIAGAVCAGGKQPNVAATWTVFPSANNQQGTAYEVEFEFRGADFSDAVDVVGTLDFPLPVQTANVESAIGCEGVSADVIRERKLNDKYEYDDVATRKVRFAAKRCSPNGTVKLRLFVPSTVPNGDPRSDSASFVATFRWTPPLKWITRDGTSITGTIPPPSNLQYYLSIPTYDFPRSASLPPYYDLDAGLGRVVIQMVRRDYEEVGANQPSVTWLATPSTRLWVNVVRDRLVQAKLHWTRCDHVVIRELAAPELPSDATHAQVIVEWDKCDLSLKIGGAR